MTSPKENSHEVNLPLIERTNLYELLLRFPENLKLQSYAGHIT